MKNVFFEPWVGINYDNENIFSKRILVLGESHHCDRLNFQQCNLDRCLIKPEDCQRLTCDVVNEYLSNKKWEKWFITFRKFEQAISGKKLDDHERNTYWNSLMFYNYTQLPMAHAKIRPNYEQLKYSEIAFHEVLDTFKPHIIITWGHLIFDTISKSKEKMIVSIPNPDLIMNIPTISYDLSRNNQCLVFPIEHPSSGRFSPTHWYKVIKYFI